jgi:RNA polymerase sigma factor (sigma-70 family)
MNFADNNPSLMKRTTDSVEASVNVVALEQLSDVELLRQFVEQKNQSAMTAIIDRHGRLVMGVCRQILKSEHDAADAFQATFLVLLKKADSLHKLTSLAGWLYGVARRVAQKARSQSSRRQKREGAGVAMNPTAPPVTRTDEETIDLIHAELESLPEKYRLPLILCCLEGEARERAAELLGWTVGSLKGRLERGREMLIARLERRGVILSAAILTGLMAQQASAAVPVAVASSTVSALSMVAAGQSLAGGAVSVQAVTLTEGVLKAMLIAKLKVSAIVLLAGGLATTGSVVGIQRLLAAPPAQKKGQAKTEQLRRTLPNRTNRKTNPSSRKKTF